MPVGRFAEYVRGHNTLRRLIRFCSICDIGGLPDLLRRIYTKQILHRSIVAKSDGHIYRLARGCVCLVNSTFKISNQSTHCSQSLKYLFSLPQGGSTVMILYQTDPKLHLNLTKVLRSQVHSTVLSAIERLSMKGTHLSRFSRKKYKFDLYRFYNTGA